VQLTEDLKEIYRHFLMLDEFSYNEYKDVDIQSFWFMKGVLGFWVFAHFTFNVD
jgi:hypothetical protein